MTGNAVLMGLLSALDTLASQAWGAGNKKQVGRLLQKSILIMLVCAIPVLVSSFVPSFDKPFFDSVYEWFVIYGVLHFFFIY